MLPTRPERMVAWIGFAAIAALLTLTVLAWRDYTEPTSASGTALASQRTQPPVAASPAAAPPVAATPPPVAATPAGSTQPPPPAPPKSRPASEADTIALHAARGDCWLEVRRGDEVLFAGILAEGQRRSFSGRRLELTLGAPNNVDAKLNGKSVTNFPDGTSTAVLAEGRLEFAPIS